MAESFTIDFPKKDVNALIRQMKRAQKDLGHSEVRAVRAGMRSVLTQLAKATKVSQPYRDFSDTGEKSRSGKTNKYIVRTRYATPMRKGKALRRSWTAGPLRDQVIYAKNARELKRRPALIIAMRGLAAESWKQAGKRGNAKISKAVAASPHGRYARAMKRAAHRWVTYSANLRGADKHIIVTNRLRHISDALYPGAVSQALRKAADSMEKSITKQIARRLGAT